MILVHTETNLSGDGDLKVTVLARFPRSPHGRRHQLGKKIELPGQRGPATLTSDLGGRTAKVEINVVGAVLSDENPNGRSSGGSSGRGGRN